MSGEAQAASSPAPQKSNLSSEASELAPDEARRRVRLAYALLHGLVPWPGEAVLPPPGETLPDAHADGATGGPKREAGT
jgi:hypothetical protein